MFLYFCIVQRGRKGGRCIFFCSLGSAVAFLPQKNNQPEMLTRRALNNLAIDEVIQNGLRRYVPHGMLPSNTRRLEVGTFPLRVGYVYNRKVTNLMFLLQKKSMTVRIKKTSILYGTFA
jgi:hypothetical protein